MGVAADLVGQGLARVASVHAHCQAGEVEGVEDQLDLVTDQLRVDLVAVAVQRDRRGLGDPAVLGPAESFRQVGGLRQEEVIVLGGRKLIGIVLQVPSCNQHEADGKHTYKQGREGGRGARALTSDIAIGELDRCHP